ncbi:cache domain-containing protein [Microbacterium sp. NPDC089321]|uniref:cache domain-containing protein n=1 Tax=Microbacterium sp. NPDC089321 TaxID=3155183 RepID=UPI003444512D
MEATLRHDRDDRDARTLTEAIEAVDEFFAGVFEPFDAWAPSLSAELVERLTSGPLSGPQLVSMVADRTLAILTETERPLYGAGFCLGTDLISDGSPLAWWQGEDRTLIASSIFGSGHTAISLYGLEWYRVPQTTGRRHIAGPFVDYLCSNQLNLTVSMPITVDGRVVGIAGADVLVSEFERALLPRFTGTHRMTLVNEHGRVVISTDPDYETGDRLADMGAADTLDDLGAHWIVRRSADHPFAVVAPAV